MFSEITGYVSGFLETVLYPNSHYLWTVFFLLVGYKWFTNGVYPAVCIAFTSIFLSFIRPLSFQDIVNGTNAVLLNQIIACFLIDRKKFSRPVYIVVSKRSMFKAPFFSKLLNFSSVKHWMIVVPGKSPEKGYYVFHATSPDSSDSSDSFIGNVRPDFRVMSRKKLFKKCGGFFRLGLTSPSIIKRYLEDEKKFKTFVSCQQYVTKSAMILTHHWMSSIHLTQYYGRFDYYLFIFGIGLMALINFFFLYESSWKIPLNLVHMLFTVIDVPEFQNEDVLKHSTRRINWFANLTSTILGGVIYYLLWFRGDPWNGECVLVALFTTFCFWLFARLFVPKFEDYEYKECSNSNSKEK